jgi:hypothetical protein
LLRGRAGRELLERHSGGSRAVGRGDKVRRQQGRHAERADAGRAAPVWRRGVQRGDGLAEGAREPCL